ncbi:HNH endonuclease [Kitasatospora cystarginea]|uniref:HNH endonuclease n=1 Tax=Kitasatospora cystarginea TaxID=58350 RepID=A0ABN3DCD1_9ACTN
MTRRRAYTVCTVPGCPEYTTGGRCENHRREAEQRRGSARARGYDRTHEREFRAAVLARNPLCVLCRAEQARRPSPAEPPRAGRGQLAASRDPNDPTCGRGLCPSCHSAETSRHQPDGWSNR